MAPRPPRARHPTGCSGCTSRSAEATWTATASARSYSANDPELLRWVHIAFTDAFLSAHKIWGGPIPGGPDAYVREWAQAGRLMGVEPAAQRGGNAAAAGPLVRRRRAPLAMKGSPRRWRSSAIRPCIPRCGAATGCCLPPLCPASNPSTGRCWACGPPRLGPFPLPVRLGTKVTLGVVHLALGRVGPERAGRRARLRRLGSAADSLTQPDQQNRARNAKRPRSRTGANRGEWGI